MIRPKVVVTGAKGQVGNVVVSDLQSKGYEVYGLGRQEMDITNAQQVTARMKEIHPDVVIHAAAYTNVDLAESEPNDAYRVNADGTRHIANASSEIGAKLVYISTDYVFNGLAASPYAEHAEPSPLGVYGKSKYVGETYVRELHNRAYIVRTSWVYGLYGVNFVTTMLNLAKERHTLSVVADQVGSPTYADDLAVFLRQLIQTDLFGIYHASNIGTCSRYQFAKAIFEEANLSYLEVRPVKTDDFPRPAPRPAYSVLDHYAIRERGLNDLPNWRESLRKFIRQYLNLE